MRKKILLMLSVFCFMGATVFGQAIEGGAGVIHVDSDPNLDITLDTVTVNEGNLAYDKLTKTLYLFDPSGTPFAISAPAAGTRWVAVDVSNLVDPITSIIVDAAGSPELTANTVAGVTTLSFESDATLLFDEITNTLTFTDVDGDSYPVNFNTLDSLVDVQAANASVTVTGSGASTDPYLISVTGADVPANAGMIPVTNGAGVLTWTDAVTGAVINSTTGELELTMTDGNNVNVDLSTIPEVTNMGEVTARITALTSGESAFLKAANNNTFGMPATNGFGVIFVIEKP